MSADPFYEVLDYSDPYHIKIGHADTLVAAEKRARWYAARHARRYAIERLTPTRRGGIQREQVATVIRDNAGKVWTDVQTMDALL